MKVFWCWQSDTKGKIGRHFVKGALRKALEELSQDPEIKEPSEREDAESLHLDHDIQGTTGSPNLVETIIKKIEAATVFVADITCVGHVFDDNTEGKTNKKLINSNVGIELGYAQKALSDERVLLVFNRHYGTHADMPFDLRHKGNAITFNLAPDASTTLITEQELQLKNRFVQALRPLLIEAKNAVAPSFPETPSRYCKAAYFEKGQTIAEHGAEHDGRITFSYEGCSLLYLRLIPTWERAVKLRLAEISKVVQSVPLLGEKDSLGYQFAARNEFGAIRWDPKPSLVRSPAAIERSTQIFPTGEIWAISTSSLVMEAPHANYRYLNYPFIACESFERIFRNKTRSFLQFSASNLAIDGPWTLICGLSGVKETYMAHPNGGQVGPFHNNELETRRLVGMNDSSVDEALLAFFSLVWDHVGIHRPDHLFGFPPG